MKETDSDPLASEPNESTLRAFGPVRAVLALAAAVVFAGVFGLVVFGSAGTVRLPWVWAYLSVFAVLWFVGTFVIDEGLLRERLRPGKGGDRFLLVVARPLLLGHLILCGIDVGRWHVSDGLPSLVRIASLAGLALSGGWLIVSMMWNPYFSPVVRVQEERGHELVDRGPYAWVRHPGYLATCGICIFSAPALGSLVGAVPIVGFAVLVVRRLLIEETELLGSLPGYPEYVQRVRYRLVPGIW